MADPKRTVTIDVNANDNASSKFKQAAQNAKKELGTLDTLKGGLGEESAFGKSVKALQGAGVVAGLALAGRELADLSKKSGELALEFAKGDKSTGDIVEELAKGIPIFGSFVEAGRNWRAQLDGSAKVVAALNAENEKTTKALDLQTTMLERAKETYKQIGEIIRGIANQTGMGTAGAAGAWPTFLEGLRQGNENAKKSLDTPVDAAQKKIREDREAAHRLVQQAIDGVIVPTESKFNPLLPGGGNNRKEIEDAQATQEMLRSMQRRIDATADDQLKKLENQRRAGYGLADTHSANEYLRGQARESQQEFQKDQQEQRTVRDDQRRDRKAQFDLAQKALRSVGKDYEADLNDLTYAHIEQREAIDEKMMDDIRAGKAPGYAQYMRNRDAVTSDKGLGAGRSERITQELLQKPLAAAGQWLAGFGGGDARKGMADAFMDWKSKVSVRTMLGMDWHRDPNDVPPQSSYAARPQAVESRFLSGAGGLDYPAQQLKQQTKIANKVEGIFTFVAQLAQGKRPSSIFGGN